MWVLVLMTLLNGCLPNDWLILKMAVNVGGMPINILDWTLFLAFIIVVAYPRGIRFQTDRDHPLLWVILGLMFCALLGGTAMAFAGQFQLDPKWMVRCIRHFAALPAGIFVGYYLLPTPQSGKFFSYIYVICGLATATLIISFFGDKSQEMSGVELSTGGVNALRTVQYTTSFATLVACLLIFSVLSGYRMMPSLLALAIAGVCIVGVFVTITRAEWVAAIAPLMGTYFLIPRGRRSGLLLKYILSAVVLVVFLIVSVHVASIVLKQDFASKIGDRFMTMLPWVETKVKAWDTRTGGIQMEWGLFLENPLLGKGFGIQYALTYLVGGIPDLRHCAFTSVMCETGLLGITPVLMTFGVMISSGKRCVNQSAHPGTVLMGAVGYIAAIHFIFLGLSTMSFNIERIGMLVGMIAGMTMRSRMMSETLLRMWAGYEQYDESDPYLGYHDQLAMQ